MKRIIPDRWEIILVDIINEEKLYKVFAEWRGGYTSGNSWKMNSGIKSTEYTDPYYLFHGYSGSVYECHKDRYGLGFYGESVLKTFIHLSEQSDVMRIHRMEENVLEKL